MGSFERNTCYVICFKTWFLVLAMFSDGAELSWSFHLEGAIDPSPLTASFLFLTSQLLPLVTDMPDLQKQIKWAGDFFSDSIFFIYFVNKLSKQKKWGFPLEGRRHQTLEWKKYRKTISLPKKPTQDTSGTTGTFLRTGLFEFTYCCQFFQLICMNH